MSEDEILKDIDNYISFANKAENFSDINEYLHCKELARRMKGLLDLYQKEKEKNKELENADLTTVYMKGFYDAKNKYKDKIKAKIKEYEDFRKEYAEEFRNNHSRMIICVLQELLEED